MDIVILAVIAIVIFIKLIRQFGKVDEDQKRDAIKGFITEQTSIIKTGKEQENNKPIMTMISSDGTTQEIPLIDEKSQKILSATHDLIRADFIQILEKTNLSASEFVMGATRAFEMIIEAFAAGDLETLKPLLLEDLMRQFELVINERKRSGNSFYSRIFAVEKSEIMSAKISGGRALIMIKFTSKQINYTTDSSGKVIEGSKEQVNSLSDDWVFQKNINSPDPNWIVAATSSE